jgi:hypothetical protein
MIKFLCRYISLALMASALSADTKPMTCNQSLVESYGIISYVQPVKEKLSFCSNTSKASCCPAYEQFKMYNDFSTRIRPNFIVMNDLIVTELGLLKTEISALMLSKQLENKIETFPHPVMKNKLKAEFQSIANKDINEIVDKMLRHQKTASNYISAAKSAFICTICDYTNQLFVNEKEKTITYNFETCDALAVNTILYSYLLNVIFVPYIEKLSYIIAKLRNSSKFQKLHKLGKITKSIRECQEDILSSKTNTGLTGCKNYCSYFRLNSENFEFEGYPELFANTLVDIRQFVGGKPSKYPDPPTPPSPNSASTSGASPPSSPAQSSPNPAVTPKTQRKLRLNKKPRILKSVKSNKHPSLRILSEFKNAKLKQNENTENIHRKLTERLLQDKTTTSKKSSDKNEYVDDFDFDKHIQEIDLFDNNSDDPELQEAMLDDMMEIQNAFNSADKGDFEKLVRKYFVEGYKPEIEDIDDDKVFKTSSSEKIDLNSFKTVFGFAGIDLNSIVNKMNWALDTKKIALSLIGGEDDDAEVIDSSVLDTINMTGNNDIRKFYTDNFANFDEIEEQSYRESLRDSIKYNQILLLEQQILEETSVYNYLLKNFKDKKQADEIWSDLQKKKQDLQKLKVEQVKEEQLETDLSQVDIPGQQTTPVDLSSTLTNSNSTQTPNGTVNSRKLSHKTNKNREISHSKPRQEHNRKNTNARRSHLRRTGK